MEWDCQGMSLKKKVFEHALSVRMLGFLSTKCGLTAGLLFYTDCLVLCTQQSSTKGKTGVILIFW